MRMVLIATVAVPLAGPAGILARRDPERPLFPVTNLGPHAARFPSHLASSRSASSASHVQMSPKGISMVLLKSSGKSQKVIVSMTGRLASAVSVFRGAGGSPAFHTLQGHNP